MAVTVEEFKAEYLGLLPDDTKDVEKYLAGAKSKARTAGIPVFTHNAQYDLFIYSLAAMYYDNKGMTFSNPEDAVNAQRMIDSFVLELRYATEDPEEEGVV